MGTYSNANGESSVAIGGNNKCLGSYSAAIGGNANKVNGQYAFVVGRSNNADTNYQTVIGKYNANNADNVFEIGYGSSDTDRKNIFEVLKDGRVRVYGAPTEENDVVRKIDLENAKPNLNIENGASAGSLQQKDFEYNGESIVFSDGTKGTQNGDEIPGAIASGLGSVAFGGLRYDYYTSPETHAANLVIDPESTENWGRTSTSAEGKQSFAGGGSSHAYGDWSFAFGKDNKAYQRSSTVIGGGGNIVGDPDGNPDSYSFSINLAGEGNNIKGRDNAAGGSSNTVTNERNLVYGLSNIVSGQANIVFGTKNTVDGDQNNANWGQLNLVSGFNNKVTNSFHSLVTGEYNQVQNARNSIIIGKNETNLVNNLTNSLLVGRDSNITKADQSLILGAQHVVVNGVRTISSGTANKINGGMDGIAIGYNQTYNSNYSGLIGSNSTSTHDYTYLFGNALKSSKDYQLIIGNYNDPKTTTLFEIGNGAWNNRSNAFEVLTDGRAKVQSAPTEDNDVVRKKELDDKFALIMDDEGLTEALDSFKEFQNILVSDTTGAAGLIDKVGENTEKINQISDGDRIIVKETTDNDTDAVNVAYMKQYIKEHFAELMDEYLTENTATEDEIGVLL